MEPNVTGWLGLFMVLLILIFIFVTSVIVDYIAKKAKAENEKDVCECCRGE